MRAAVELVDVATPAAALVELVRAARFADADVVALVAARALAHPGLPPAVRRALTSGVRGEAVGPFDPAAAGADSAGTSR